jgi:predicted metal-dependent hydrolase
VKREMKNRKYIGLVLLIVNIFIVSCSMPKINNSKSTSLSETNMLEIRGLSLKYILIETVSDMYLANVKKPDYFSAETFKKIDSASYEYFVWLHQTYDKFDDNAKNSLTQIYNSTNKYVLMNITTKLSDKAKVDDIVNILDSSTEFDEKTKSAIKEIFPYFYKKFFKSYLKSVEKDITKNVNKVRDQVKQYNPDIIKFMEENSGIKFRKKYKPICYYTLSPISASNYIYEEQAISTTPRGTNDIKHILKVIFHEYSHELFSTFTWMYDFERVTDLMYKDKSFQEVWESNFSGNHGYNWKGWCEENLVNGFSMYLLYKYSGDSIYLKRNYVYDYKFYEYLKEIQFDPEKITLIEASVNFFEDIINKQK